MIENMNMTAIILKVLLDSCFIHQRRGGNPLKSVLKPEAEVDPKDHTKFRQGKVFIQVLQFAIENLHM